MKTAQAWRVLGIGALVLPLLAVPQMAEGPFRIDDGSGDPGGGCGPDFVIEQYGQRVFTLHTTEDLTGFDGFTVRLMSRPAPGTRVRIRVQTGTPDEAQVLYDLYRYGTTVVGGLVDFPIDSTNPTLEQRVHVIGLDDGLMDGTQPFTILVRNLDRNDPSCDPVETIQGINQDNAYLKLRINVLDYVTDVRGNLATIQLRPQCNFDDCLPATDLYVQAATSNTSEALVKGPHDAGFAATGSVTFAPSAMTVYQTVQARGVDDGLAHGDASFSVRLTASSADPRWQGVTATVDLVNRGPTDQNRCLDDVATKFADLPGDGTRLALDDRGFPAGEYHPFGQGWTDWGNHFQGVQRLRNGPYLLISGKGEHASDLFVAWLDKAGSIYQGRWNHNLPPDATETVIWHDVIDRDYDHAGGISLMGDFAAVPLQYDFWDQSGPPNDGLSKVVFFDLFDPTLPVRVAEVVRRGLQENAGAVAVTKLIAGSFTGRYFMAVESDDVREIQFYLSNGNGIRGGAEVFPETFWIWSTYHNDAPNYNNINFVQQCNGQLYMLGTYNSGLAGGGTNYADLYAVTPPSRLPGGEVTPPAVSRVATRSLTCDTGDWCNFGASAGAYVSSTNELILYSTHYYRNVGGDDQLRMKEF